MCIAEHLPDLFSAAPPPAAISLAPNLPITADKNQAAALPPPPGFSFPGFGGTSSSSAPPTLFGQVASAAKPATTTSKRTPNATATTNALPPSAPSAMPLLFPSTAPSPSSFSSGNLAVPAALSANSVGASLFSPPPVSNGKLAPPAVKTAESVLQLGKNSTVADSSVTIEASKGTQVCYLNLFIFNQSPDLPSYLFLKKFKAAGQQV